MNELPEAWKPRYWMLDGHTPVGTQDLYAWGEFMQGGKRAVGKAHDPEREILVSTIFLGLDHGYDGGPPVLFETMIFGGPHDDYQKRYCTWDEAERGHAVACELAGVTPFNESNKENSYG